jgi:uncharacterized heparinase superfamily protein
VLGPSVRSVQRLGEPEFLRLFVGASARQDAAGMLRHFGRRVAAEWPPMPDEITDLRIDLSSMSDAEIVRRADAALEGDLHPSGVRPRFTDQGNLDWAHNPAESREWLLMIHRHAWWPLWGAAYQRTGDEKYAHAFVAQMLDWTGKNPLPRYKSEESCAWRLMEAGLRMRISWIPSFGCFFESEAFTDAAKMRMLRAFYDHGQFLDTFFTNRNHLVRESNGLLALALTFSEFVDSSQWAESATQRLALELRSQVNADGSHLEMSIGYQWLTIIEFEITRTLLHQGGQETAIDGLDAVLHKMYQLLAAIIRPDGTFPQLNDGFLLWGADRLINTARQRGWDDIVYAASAGRFGAPPDYCSRSFPNAGLQIMRSGWTEDARYLVADTGPYGGPHGHEDKLSFELSAYGAQFIIDPGSYTYAKDDPFRQYFVGSQGHNTVLVDDCSQVRRWIDENLTPEVEDKVHGAWRGDDTLDAASGIYDEGYAKFAIQRPDDAHIISDVTHKRDFVFAKPDYWVIADHLLSGRTHDYTFLFHLAPDATVEELCEMTAIVRSQSSGARLVICALTDNAMRSEEIDGWYSEDHHKKCEAPVLRFSIAGADTASVTWVLYPLPPGADATEVRATIEHDEIAAEKIIRVRRAGISDAIRLPAEVSIDEQQMTASLAQICIAKGT